MWSLPNDLPYDSVVSLKIWLHIPFDKFVRNQKSKEKSQNFPPKYLFTILLIRLIHLTWLIIIVYLFLECLQRRNELPALVCSWEFTLCSNTFLYFFFLSFFLLFFLTDGCCVAAFVILCDWLIDWFYWLIDFIDGLIDWLTLLIDFIDWLIDFIDWLTLLTLPIRGFSVTITKY